MTAERPDGGAEHMADIVTGLTDRLGPHVRHRFDSGADAWWSPPGPSRAGWRPWGAVGTRAEQLSQVLERLAVLVAAGDRLVAAVEHIAAAGRGTVAMELGAVGEALRSGQPHAEALHAWARRTGCPAVGVLAADVRRATSSDDLVAVLQHHAAARSQVVHRRRVERLRRRVQVVWLGAVASGALSAVAVLM